MSRTHIRHPRIGELFPRGSRAGNLVWALIAARSDLEFAALLVGNRDENVPLIGKGQRFAGDGEFFVRSFFFRSTWASLKSICWLLNGLNGCDDFRGFLAAAKPSEREQFLQATKALNRADEFVTDYRNSYGSHVEEDFAASRDRLDDHDTVPLEFSAKGLAPRTASAVVMVALLKNAKDQKKGEAEFAELVEKLGDVTAQAIIATDLAISFYLAARMPR